MPGEQFLRMQAIDEAEPGAKWRARFDALWPAYSVWYGEAGLETRSSLEEGRAALAEHMPELLPTFELLCTLTNGDRAAQRLLTGYCIPQLRRGTSLVIASGQDPFLVRNYDHDPVQFEASLWRSALLGQNVVAVSDLPWGALDGMNNLGLAAALTFGARRALGLGFHPALVLRYVLEVCETTAEAVSVLMRMPLGEAASFMLIDRDGDYRVVHLLPDGEPAVLRSRLITDHDLRIDWHEDAEERPPAVLPSDRTGRLTAMIGQGPAALDLLADAFVRPPRFQRERGGWFGTLYTAIYRPLPGRLELRWSEASWQQSLLAFDEGERKVDLGLAA